MAFAQPGLDELVQIAVEHGGGVALTVLGGGSTGGVDILVVLISEKTKIINEWENTNQKLIANIFENTLYDWFGQKSVTITNKINILLRR